MEEQKYMFLSEEDSKVIDQQIPPEEIVYDIADLFKVFSDMTRVKILYALSSGELCVYDISAVLEMSQSAISHQLRVLKQAKLVKYRREGKIVFYSLADSHIHTILNQGLEHVQE
ncbi:MAG: helix-turn-helix transcriptional regulator [Lachnospiraceae bacterium]|jgi:DNA-binding transcriptional ArsR family regulator|nr:helix-turn-helix transcriptional regulator [Lachnospiraceae bacterium]MBQ5559956.1 helix-turn-helix transcriptional regulator [Lachnospiraceae bacterium]MCR4802721.1 metalloregulator ArsR/SmtB family transcription factor [Lachnospiraceae bacterium]